MTRVRFSRKYFAIPYVFLSAVFVIIPLIILLVRAFQGRDGGFTFQNFLNYFTSENMATLKVTGRSFGIAALTTMFCLVLAYPLAMILANSKINKSAILVLMFILPMWINSLLRTTAIKTLLDLINLKNNYWRVVIGMVYDFFPFMLLPIYTILVNMDKSYLEASTDLGANSVKTFLRVTLPLSVPGIVSGILMTFMPTVSTFAISDILGGPDTYMVGNLINSYFEQNNYNTGSAYAFILMIFIGITMIIANKINADKGTVTGGAL